MPGICLLPLGVGNAFSARYYSTCLAVGAEGHWLLIDCPHPIRKMLHEAAQAAGLPLRLEQFEDVVLTHLHADHCSGLEMYLYYFHIMHQKKPRLYAHPAVAERLWSSHLAAGMEWSVPGPGQPAVQRRPEDFFELILLAEDRPVPAGPFHLYCRRTVHSVPTTALRLEAAGQVLAYSADTAYDPELLAWLAPADLIVHETGPAPAHTPYEQLRALPEDLRQRLRLVHYPDDFDGEHSEIPVLQQGRCYLLSR